MGSITRHLTAAHITAPHLALPTGTLLVGALVMGLFVFAGDKRSQAKTNAEIEKGLEGLLRTVGVLLKAVGRFAAGRELWGPPRSTATVWRVGTPVRAPVRRRPGRRTSLESIAAVPPRVSLTKRHPRPWARRAARWTTTYNGRFATGLDRAAKAVRWSARAVGRTRRGLRATWSAVAPAVRILRMWHCWPYAARGAARVAVVALLVVAEVPAWQGPALLVALAAAVLLGALLPKVAAGGGDDAVYGPRIWAILRDDLKLPDDEPREDWLQLPKRLADTGARIIVRLPVTFRGSELERQLLTDLINSRLPGEWASRFTFTGEHYTAVYTHKPPPRAEAPEPEPPSAVDIWDPKVQEILTALGPDEFYLGQDEHDQPIIQKMADEQAHWALSVGSGGGKSGFLQFLAIQMLMKRGTVIPIDPKMVSMTPLIGIQGVHEYIDPENPRDMRRVLLWIKEVVRARNFEKKKKIRTEFPALYVILEECNELADLLKEDHAANKVTGDSAADPIWRDAVAKILRLGREVNVHIIAVFQDFKDTQFGGVSLVPLFPFKILGSYNQRQWDRIIGSKVPMPPVRKKAGRMVMVLDNGSVTRIQVPYAPFDPEKTKDENQQAAYQRLTAYYEQLREEHGYSADGLYSAPPAPSPEAEPALLRTSSRDGAEGPMAASGDPWSDETAGGPSQEDDAVTAHRDRLRLIPGQGGRGAQGAAQDPTAPPELLPLAEVARRLEGAPGVPSYDTMRAHKTRESSTRAPFPTPTVISGKELFTVDQVRAYYETQEKNA